MKKSYLFGAIGALLLASCANESVVNPAPSVVPNDTQTPMLINSTLGNMSRANLENETPAFGVYAIKANNQADIVYDAANKKGATLVMNDYLVGYWNNTWGYKPADNENFYGGDNWYFWYYQHLGSADNHLWMPGSIFTSATEPYTSRNQNQYLKYWDKDKTNTYFYAFAPYTKTDGNATATFSLEDGKSVLTFSEIQGQTPWSPTSTETAFDANYMYAMVSCVNADMINNKKTVNLQFKHLMAQIRLAFYEEVDGYKVDIVGLNTSNPYVYCVPAKYDAAATPQYSLGQYLNKATVKVTFDETTAAVTYANATSEAYSKAVITHPADWFIDVNGDRTSLIGNNYDNRVFGDKFAVIPANTAAGKGNDGFTLNVSLKFTALDTDETIYVRGARVYVPASDTQWEANKLYTYVFKITNKVPGTTGTYTGDPSPEPTTDTALWPIIFDNVTVQDYTEVEHEYPVN